MAYENIRLRKQNVVVLDGYFYSIDEDIDSLVVKTDDGTQAFSYPLDTTITDSIVSLEYDGRNFWSLSNLGSDNIRIRRWYLSNYICTLRDTFDLVAGTHYYDSNAFTVEHYHETFTADEGSGQHNLSISDGSKIFSGMTVTLGPNSSGQIEECSVSSAGAGYVNINGTTSYSYSTGDSVSFYKYIWLFNNYNVQDDTTGGLYKIDPYTAGSVISVVGGGAYQDVEAATFFNMYDAVSRPTWSEAICYVKGTNMLFLDPDDLDTSFGSMVMDNIEDDNATVIAIYDLTMEGTNIYRLQLKATYYGETKNYTDGPYNYQLSTSNAFITSISLRADPAILPANGLDLSDITAIVKDQFLLPVASKTVYFTDDDPDGAILDPSEPTNAYGVATTQYMAGLTSREVKITSTCQH